MSSPAGSLNQESKRGSNNKSKSHDELKLSIFLGSLTSLILSLSLIISKF
jgi:hypothetical protein